MKNLNNYTSNNATTNQNPSTSTSSLFVAGASENPRLPADAGRHPNPSSSADRNGLQITKFEVLEKLSECTDSMLFDSDTNIANLNAVAVDGVKVVVCLMVRGEVSVTYQGKTYRKPSQFPQELKNRIKAHPNKWEYPNGTVDLDDLSEEDLGRIAEMADADAEDEDPEIYVSANNWFEYIYEFHDGDDVEEDGILCECALNELSDEDLKAEMLKVAQEILEMYC